MAGKMLATLQERAKTLTELVDAAHYYLSDEIVLEEKAAKKFLTRDAAAPIQSLIEKLAMLSEFTEAAIEQAFTNTLNEYGIQMGKLAQPVRVALTERRRESRDSRCHRGPRAKSARLTGCERH